MLFDQFIDGISMKYLPVLCGEDVDRNSYFIERYYGSAHLDTETPSKQEPESFNKESADDGACQDLFIDKSYIEKHILFQVTNESFFSRYHSIYVVVMDNS